MSDEEDKVPEYLANETGEVVGLKNMGPEDTVWTGKDGELDPDEVIAEHGHDPETPLVWLVLAIIAAHPSNEPRTLSYQITLFGPISVDVRHFRTFQGNMR